MSELLSAEVRPGALNRWRPRRRKCEEVATISLLPAETHSQPQWGWRAWRTHREKTTQVPSSHPVTATAQGASRCPGEQSGSLDSQTPEMQAQHSPPPNTQEECASYLILSFSALRSSSFLSRTWRIFLASSSFRKLKSNP